MNLRIPITAAMAVLLASLSLHSVLQGNGWLAAGFGAVVVVAAAGLATRLPALPAAVTTTAVVLIGVVPLLSAPTWPLRGAGLVVAALTAASATGWRPARSFAALACYLAALLIYLNLVYASAASFARIIPTSHSVEVLGRMVPRAFDGFSFSPPVPDIRPISLVAAAGIGLIAILVDILAVRLRRPAIAGIPLLVLFSVPVASSLKTFGVVQSVGFGLALAGYLALLSADGRMRLRMWGRLVTFRYVQPADETGTGPDTKELAASGRRIGLAAVCLAVIIPIILPAAHTRAIFGTTDNGNSHGAGGGLNAFLGVQRDLAEHPQPVLSYSTTADDPAQQYFQVFSLNYSSQRNLWSPQFPLGVVGSRPVITPTLPYSPDGQLATSPTRKVRTTVHIAADQGGPVTYLPVPYAPVKLDIRGSGWEELAGSLMILSSVQGRSDLQYTVTSREPDPTPASINKANGQFVPAIIQNQYGIYAGPDEGKLLTIARAQTQGALTPLQAAIDLQNWLQSGAFTYTLKPDLPSTSHWLLKFLTTGRRGYCQQFAWAFAVLARLSGIPSRIAVGYTGGSFAAGGVWQVTTADAHAWPELYFPGHGWLRFEPTPHGAGGQGSATVPRYANARSTGPNGTLPGGSSQNSTGRGGTATGGKKTSPLNHFAHGQPGVAGATAGHPAAGQWLAIGIPLFIVLLCTWPALTRVLTRRRRWLTASGDAALAHAAWRELNDDLTDLGLPRSPGETPRAVARRVGHEARLDAKAADALARIATAEERARYARLAMPAAGLAGDVRLVRGALRGAVPRRQRIRSRLLPASTLAAARRVLDRVAYALSWLDSSWPALRRQLRRTIAHRSA